MENFYNKEIYGNYEDDIENYINTYKPENYYEIIKTDKRTPIFKIFSPDRANIVRWIPFKEEDKILEVGANYGEITQFLIKKSKNIFSIELKKNKISCIKKRLLNNPNLSLIYTENIKELDFDFKFDYILLIGIPEYHKQLGFDKLEDMLIWTKKNLKENGKVILGIDNLLGVKYLSGVKKVPYEDSFANYKPSIIKNYSIYGKNQLEEIIKNSGFKNYRFYYPLPDYNLANIIYTDNYLPHANTYNLYYNDYDVAMYNEQDLISKAIANNCFSTITNSFLVEITNDDLSDMNFICYSNMRKEEYKIYTKMDDKNVVKKTYDIQSLQHIKNCKKNIEILKNMGYVTYEEGHNDYILSKYIEITTMDNYLNNLVNLNKIDSFYEEIDKWYLYLKNINIKNITSNEECFQKYNVSITTEQKQKLTFVNNAFIDLVFPNIFYDGNEYIVFDQEWRENGVPLEFIFYRGLRQFILNYKELGKFIKFDELLSKYNLIEFKDIFDELEQKWQNSIINNDILNFYKEKWNKIITLEDIKKDYNNEINFLRKENDELNRQKQNLEEKYNVLVNQESNERNELNLIKQSKIYKIINWLDRRNNG